MSLFLTLLRLIKELIKFYPSIVTGVKAITGKAATQLTQAGGDGNELVCIELRTEELDIANGFEHVSVRVTIANANVEYAVVLFGAVPRYLPVATTNWSEIVD